MGLNTKGVCKRLTSYFSVSTKLSKNLNFINTLRLLSYDLLTLYTLYKKILWECRTLGEEPIYQRLNDSKEGSNILVSWDLLKIYNRIFGKCPIDGELHTKEHITIRHGLFVPDLEVLIQLGLKLEKKIKGSSRKGRIFEKIELIRKSHLLNLKLLNDSIFLYST